MSAAPPRLFASGQVWHYRTRAQEPQSTLLINRVEREPGLGEVFHISVLGVRVKNRHNADGLSGEVAHAPLTRAALESSVLDLAGTAPVNRAFNEGYATWRRAFEAGEAGVFTLGVAEIVDFVENTIAAG